MWLSTAYVCGRARWKSPSESTVKYHHLNLSKRFPLPVPVPFCHLQSSQFSTFDSWRYTTKSLFSLFQYYIFDFPRVQRKKSHSMALTLKPRLRLENTHSEHQSELIHFNWESERRGRETTTMKMRERHESVITIWACLYSSIVYVC